MGRSLSGPRAPESKGSRAARRAASTLAALRSLVGRSGTTSLPRLASAALCAARLHDPSDSGAQAPGDEPVRPGLEPVRLGREQRGRLVARPVAREQLVGQPRVGEEELAPLVDEVEPGGERRLVLVVVRREVLVDDGRPVWGGLDIAGANLNATAKNDGAGFAAVAWEPDGKLRLVCHRIWKAPVDLASVEAFLVHLDEKLDLRGVLCDPFQAARSSYAATITELRRIQSELGLSWWDKKTIGVKRKVLVPVAATAATGLLVAAKKYGWLAALRS